MKRPVGRDGMDETGNGSVFGDTAALSQQKIFVDGSQADIAAMAALFRLSLPACAGDVVADTGMDAVLMLASIPAVVVAQPATGKRAMATTASRRSSEFVAIIDILAPLVSNLMKQNSQLVRNC